MNYEYINTNDPVLQLTEAQKASWRENDNYYGQTVVIYDYIELLGYRHDEYEDQWFNRDNYPVDIDAVEVAIRYHLDNVSKES